MNYYPVCKSEISYLVVKLNGTFTLPSILYTFMFTWRWPSWPTYVL